VKVKVSIIIPVYNAEEFIESTIESILKQDVGDIQIILVDDKSTDNSVQIINERFLDNKNIELIEMSENVGKANAINSVMDRVNGEFLAFIDADDIWEEKKLKTQISFMEDNNYSFTFTAYDKIDEFGNKLGTIYAKDNVSYKNMLKFSRIGYSTVVLRFSSFDKIVVPELRKRQDYALWLNLLKKHDAYGLNIPLTSYLVRKGSLSSNKFEMMKWNYRVYREIEKLNPIKSCYYLMWDILSKVLLIK